MMHLSGIGAHTHTHACATLMQHSPHTGVQVMKRPGSTLVPVDQLVAKHSVANTWSSKPRGSGHGGDTSGALELRGIDNIHMHQLVGTELITRCGRPNLYAATHQPALLAHLDVIEGGNTTTASSKLWHVELPSMLAKTLTCLGIVAQHLLPEQYKQQPTLHPHKAQWRQAINAMHTTVAPHVPMELVEAACQLIYPLHVLKTTVPTPARASSNIVNLEAAFNTKCVPYLERPSPTHPYIQANTKPMSGYIRLKLGSVKAPGQSRATIVQEYLHGLLLWAYVGPPPSIQQCYAIHVCANEWCINPKHLYWASNSSNKSNTREAHTAVVTAAAGTRGGMAEWCLPS